MTEQPACRRAEGSVCVWARCGPALTHRKPEARKGDSIQEREGRKVAILIPTLKVWIPLLSHSNFPKILIPGTLGSQLSIYLCPQTPHPSRCLTVQHGVGGSHSCTSFSVTPGPQTPGSFGLTSRQLCPSKTSSLALPHWPTKSFPRHGPSIYICTELLLL